MASSSRAFRLFALRHGESENNANELHDLRSSSNNNSSGGESAAAECQRQADPPLSVKGERQVAIAARFLSKRPLVGLFTSAMRRALGTAAPFASSYSAVHGDKLAVHCWPALLHEEGGLFGGRRTERGVGHDAVHGMSVDEVRAALPGVEVTSSAFLFGGADGGEGAGWWKGRCETEDEVAARATAAAEALWRLAEEHAEAGHPPGEAPACVLVTHGLFFDRLLKTLLGWGGGAVRSGGDSGASGCAGEVFFQVANCSLTVLDFIIESDEAQGSGSAGAAAAIHMSALNELGYLPRELHTKTSLNGFRPPALTKLFGFDTV